MSWKILPLLLLISGCSLFGRGQSLPEVAPIEIIKVVRQQTVYNPPLPSKISSLPVKWTVLTPITMADYLKDLENGDAPQNAFYGLTKTGYENLSNNLSEIKRYIRQLRSVVEYYQDINKPKNPSSEDVTDAN